MSTRAATAERAAPEGKPGTRKSSGKAGLLLVGGGQVILAAVLSELLPVVRGDEDDQAVQVSRVP